MVMLLTPAVEICRDSLPWCRWRVNFSDELLDIGLISSADIFHKPSHHIQSLTRQLEAQVRFQFLNKGLIFEVDHRIRIILFKEK